MTQATMGPGLYVQSNSSHRRLSLTSVLTQLLNVWSHVRTSLPPSLLTSTVSNSVTWAWVCESCNVIHTYYTTHIISTYVLSAYSVGLCHYPHRTVFQSVFVLIALCRLKYRPTMTNRLSTSIDKYMWLSQHSHNTDHHSHHSTP